MSPSPSVTAGAVEHLAVIGKMARLGTINRAAIVEPIAAGRRWSAAHDQLTRMSPSINVFVPGFCLPYTGYTDRLQRADASFELAPNTAAMITWMYIAILNNTVYLVQF